MAMKMPKNRRVEKEICRRLGSSSAEKKLAVQNLLRVKLFMGTLGSRRDYGHEKAQKQASCTSQQKVDTFFIFYTLKTEHSTPYIVLVSNSLMSMQVFLH